MYPRGAASGLVDVPVWGGRRRPGRNRGRNGVPASARYLTLATGGDYSDVPPTSGSYLGASGGRLTTNRRAAVLAAA
jgi:hypothetical protein